MSDLIPANKFREVFFERANRDQTFEDAVEELISLMMSGTGDKIQLAALLYFFDRVLGKPATSEIVQNEGEINVKITRVEGRSAERFKEIVANAQEKWAKEREKLEAEEQAAREAEAEAEKQANA